MTFTLTTVHRLGWRATLMAKHKKRRKQKLSPQERQLRYRQRQFRQRIQNVFRISGFDPIATRNKPIIIGDRRSEFDSVFVYENLVVLGEDTCSQSTYEHLLKKNQFYDHLAQHKDELIQFLTDTFPQFRTARKAEYDISDYDIVILYCSDHPVDESYKQRFPNIHFLHGRHIRYFKTLAAALGKSARFELFKFFGLKARDIGHSSGVTSKTYEGFILPESPSGFPKGYKLATFYADPETLISLSYVLRKDISE